MTIIHEGSSPRGGLAPLSIQIDAAEQLHRLLFSDSDWNRIIRAGLHAFGQWFVDERLPLRFGSFARTDLGYNLKETFDRHNVLAAAKADGTLQRLCDKYLHGWNPWKSTKVPGQLWKEWLAKGWAQGKYQISVTGVFSGAKRDLRTHAKMLIRGELEGMYQDEKFQTPLVQTGELREQALSSTQVRAVATSSSQAVTISIPSPHPTRPIVGAVLRRITDGEIDMGAAVLGRTIDGLIGGSTAKTVARGPNTGQVRRALTSGQRDSIAHTIQNQRGGVSQTAAP